MTTRSYLDEGGSDAPILAAAAAEGLGGALEKKSGVSGANAVNRDADGGKGADEGDGDGEGAAKVRVNDRESGTEAQNKLLFSR